MVYSPGMRIRRWQEMMSRFLFQKLPHTDTAGEPAQRTHTVGLLISQDPLREPHLRFVSPVAPVVDSRGDADHDGREEVTRHVVVLFPRVLALEDLHQHEVQLDPLKTHPGEGGQEEEVEDPRDDGASDLRQNNKTDLDNQTTSIQE